MRMRHGWLLLSFLDGADGSLQQAAVVVRAPSRHTYGFEPWDLAEIELKALCPRLSFERSATEPQLLWAEGASGEELARASRRAIMVHSSFNILASGTSISSAAALLSSDSALLSSDSAEETEIALLLNGTSAVEVVDLSRPDLPQGERLALLSELRHAFLTRSSEQRQAAAAAPQVLSGAPPPPPPPPPSPPPSPPSPQPSSRSRSPPPSPPSRSPPSAADWVILREASGAAHLGWRIATGPAGGTGAPGQAIGRRSYRGLLGCFALKDRLHLTPTAMEPELAFLMANLALGGSGAPSKASNVLLYRDFQCTTI